MKSQSDSSSWIGRWAVVKATARRVYEVSDGGLARSGQKILKPYLTSGYPSIKIDGETLYLHRLIAGLFIRPLLAGEEVNHKDGNKLNNKLENLEIVSRSENIKHAYRMGLIASGSAHHWSKYTPLEFAAITLLSRAGWLPVQIAAVLKLKRQGVAASIKKSKNASIP